MKPVTMYETVDGTRWASKDQAIQYEAVAERIANIMSVLGPRPRFVTSQECSSPYPLEQVHQCNIALTRATRDLLPADAFEDQRDTILNPAGVLYFLGHLNDARLKPLAEAWGRLSCIDELGREWTQPFYVLNPDKRPR